MKKKAILLIIVILPFLAWGGNCFIHSTHKQLDDAKALLIKGCYEQANEKLLALQSKKLEIPHTLYKGYLLLMKGHYEEAKLLFNKTRERAPHLPLLQLEATLASALCSYQQDAYHELEETLQCVHEEGRENHWFKFIEGFASFKNKKYKNVITAWKEIDYPYIEEEKLATTWGTVFFKQFLTQECFEWERAYSLIEERDFMLAREFLERMAQNDTLSSGQNIALFYLGYSYFKEAEDKPLDKQLSFYKLASFYFERTALSTLDLTQKKWMAELLCQKTKSLLATAFTLCEPPSSEGAAFKKSDEIKYDLFISLLTPLQKWHSLDELEELSHYMAENFIYSPSHSTLSFATFLQTHLEGSPFHAMITERLTHLIIQEIHQGKINAFTTQLELMERLNAHNNTFQKTVVQHALSHLDHAILQDDDTLKQLHFYLQILEKFSQINEKTTPYLAPKLLQQSKLLWQERGAELKATRLMKLALIFSSNKSATKESIEHYLVALYDQAEANNLVERLSYIHDALNLFNIKSKSAIDPSILANHLADAQYRYQTGQFSFSKMLSSWVLKLEPTNQDALRLLGLNYYHLGQYHEAVVSLKKLVTLDEDSHKALAFSEVFSAPDQSHLVRIDNINNFEEDK